MCAATSRANKAEKPHIPEINWSVNNSAAIWTLLAKIEKSENYHVLYGKKDVAKNTSGEMKVAVYARIAKAVLLELFSLNPNIVHNHIKSKLESLKNVYKKHSKQLCWTGEGVQENEDGSQGSKETLSFYIMEEIKVDFPFFPTLHCIWASCPIVITTALGPQDSKTVWYQPPDDNNSCTNDNSNIDPQLLNDTVATVAPHENLAAQKAQNQSHINLELHKQIIDEVKMGLWTIEQAQEKIEAIKNDSSPHPVKHQKKVV
ncbi:uncharacterized protein LACBIDRAFT_335284 [Laccaria bicolor S238N-H82]|uniref:Predicted protein n=1 Tax=Laccaria bicolor (strain S238N-H82 / ATCC MYA-4686) TaxID=486041 RepID=B0E1W5_LACBS|nr:uncharacterized protein LACBIDRAFT_335284 [Laccaria bicolor S238N-H82]EDQ99169.1 predicted protein [Laccaria bicolor S238N-H82]|eukprot:XP_001890186.1 predicted protein [Laccaria bicolor S238N-H82]